MINWQTVNLGELGEFKNGANFTRSDFGIGYPIINVKNLYDGRFVSINDLDELKPNTLPNPAIVSVQKNDILFARSSVKASGAGQVAMVNQYRPNTIFSGFIIRFRITENELVDPNYLNYLLRSPEYRELLTRIASGTTITNLSQDTLSRLPIRLPPLPEQRAIAGILGALDDKIELNRRMNRTLEAIARAVFREMMKDEDGRMKVGTVGEDFNLIMGQSPPGETYNEEGRGMPFFQGRADFGFRYPENRVYCTAPTRFAKAGDTLVSVRAPVGDVNMAWEECAIGRGVAAVRHKTGSRSYTYYAMKSLEEDFGRFEAEGTVFGSINKTDFQNLEIRIPTTKQVEKFEEFCYPIDQMIENNEKESRTLASLRDALLPKLMRGEVRVKDEA